MVSEFMMIAVITLIILLLRWSLGCCVCLLCCPALVLITLIHHTGLGSKMASMSWEWSTYPSYPQNKCCVCPWFASLMVENLMDSAAGAGGSWRKAADIVFHWNSSKLRGLWGSGLLCFFFLCLQRSCFSAIPEQSELNYRMSGGV